MSLTLPIVIGRPYVRRDGGVVIALPHEMENVAACGFPKSAACWLSTGRVWQNSEHEADLIADYAPHAPNPDPHAESMKLYAEDAAQTDKAWERWQGRLDRHDEWRDCTWHPAWVPREEYRRKPVA